MTRLRLEAGILVADRYEVERVIGSGGMSVVYKAYDIKLDRSVTLKVLKEEYLAMGDVAERFPEEARAAAALNHQNIVSIFDFGRDGDIVYIVLQYVDGASLKELITKRAPFDNDIILDAAIQVAEGLAEAHRGGIVHRDIKPQNILITRQSVVKVTDFGIARVAKSDTLTGGSGSMGSVHYSSPEQARNGYLDHTTDVYSLGVCMYEMATGRLPFDGETEVSVAMCHINNEFPNILNYNPKLSESIVQIIAKATEKSSSMRYQTVESMIADLKRAQHDDSGEFILDEITETPYIAPPPARPENPQRDMRQKARNAFLSDNDTNPDDDIDYDNYDYDDNEPIRSDKAAVWGGILLGLIVVAVASVIVIMFVLPRVTGGMGLRGQNIVFPPNIVGLSLQDAEHLAQDLGLYIYVQYREYSDIHPENYIIAQVQMPNYRGLTAGDNVMVIVSQGPEEVYVYTMPDLSGMDITMAETLLSALTITLRIELEFSDTIEHDTVMSQSPAPDTALRAGDEIMLRVSAGADTGQSIVPRLIGRTEAEALELLRDAMLIAGIRTSQESTTYPAGTIIMQDPLPDELIYRESIVSYTVSTGPPAADTAPPAEEPQQETPPAEEPPPPPQAEEEPPPQIETPPAEEPPLPPAEEEPPPEEDPPIIIEPDPAPPTPTTRAITVQPWEFGEGVEMVLLHIMRQQPGGVAQVADIISVSVNNFPFTHNVTDIGQVTFTVISAADDMVRGTFDLNFDD